jgi:hypothetical protein
MAEKDKRKPLRVFTKGLRVEIAPYRNGQTQHGQHGWLDGAKGTIKSLGAGNTPRILYIHVDGTPPGSVAYPSDIVKPIIEEE